MKDEQYVCAWCGEDVTEESYHDLKKVSSQGHNGPIITVYYALGHVCSGCGTEDPKVETEEEYESD